MDVMENEDNNSRFDSFSDFEDECQWDSDPELLEPEETIPKHSRDKKLVPAEKIGSIHCCQLLCLALCSNIVMQEVIVLRLFLASLSSTQRQQWLLDYLYLHKRITSEGGMEFLLLVGTKQVCQQAWLVITGFAQSTFYRIRKAVKDGVRNMLVSHGKKGQLSTNTYTAMAWLMSFASTYGDKLPDSVNIHLPMCVTKKTIYEFMISDLQQEDAKCVIAYSHFMKLWRKEMNYIKVPKVSRFSKCDICTLYKEKISKAPDQKELEELKKQRNKHLDKQHKQRQKYYKHIMKSKRQPDHYLSIILDGMDQNKTSIPHMVNNSKSVSQMWKLRVHLTGLLVHGKGLYGFFDYQQIKHNSNLTIHAILYVLSKMESLPEVLYLQLDNCGRENKNRYVLGFLCLLVELNIFRKIKLSFLMVGHTHEDIDRTFSRFGKLLHTRSAMTITELIEIWKNSEKNCHQQLCKSTKYTMYQNGLVHV